MDKSFNPQAQAAQMPQMPQFPSLDCHVIDVSSDDPGEHFLVMSFKNMQPHELSALLAIFRPEWRISIESHSD